MFVDTLDNMDWQGATGGAVQRQGAFELGGMSFDNWYRMQSQNEKPISVIISNPPYNDSATAWNDGSANRKYPELDRRIRETYVRESSAQKTHQYDMYKRFIRWASDRLDDDGIIAFITNRAYIDSMQDDGFRKVVSEEFNDLYIVDLGGNVQSDDTSDNVFGITIGVAISFFVRKSNADAYHIRYFSIPDDQSVSDKLSALARLNLGETEFADIVADKRNDWINQSVSNFENLMPLANRETKLAKADAQESAVFRLFAPGVKTDRDEWVHDFDIHNLRNKILFFSDTYNELLDNNDNTFPKAIKWSDTLLNFFQRDERIVYNDTNRITILFRPFVVKQYYAEKTMSDRLTGNHYEMFGQDLRRENIVICIKGPSANYFATIATKQLANEKFAGTNDGSTQCLPLYRYTEDGERVSNITQWGLDRVNAHYRRRLGGSFEEIVGADAITAEDIFAYTYAVLHDPVYRLDYRVDLLREFPRLPLYHDFDIWRDMGRELLDLHINFETADPFPLERVDAQAPGNDASPKVMLRANAQDKARGEIRIDSVTTLRGVPPSAWRYKLGSRSALEWVLDQYKEKKPRDPTIRERFNNYRFADYKERVIDLLRRVTTTSVNTIHVVDAMGFWLDGKRLATLVDRDEYEWSMPSLSQ